MSKTKENNPFKSVIRKKKSINKAPNINYENFSTLRCGRYWLNC